MRARGLLRERLKLAIGDGHTAHAVLGIAAPLSEARLLTPELKCRESAVGIITGFGDALARGHLLLKISEAALARLKAQNRLLAIAALGDA